MRKNDYKVVDTLTSTFSSCYPNKLLQLLTLTVSIIWLLGCTPDIRTNRLASNTLLYCSEGSPEFFNPQLTTSGTTIDAVSNQIYSRLLKIDESTGELMSDLARKVIVSDDGLRYRFYLRKGVQFHTTDYFSPSRTLNSEDVLFSFSRLLYASHPFHEVGDNGLYPFFDSINLDASIKQIILVDELTIEFRLESRNESFLYIIASDYAVILSAEYANLLITNNQTQLLDQLPVGSGPYQYKEYVRDHYIRYEAHPEYWKGAPNLDQIIFDITVNNSTRLAKLLTGECDVLGYPSAFDVNYLKDRDDISIQAVPSMNLSYWAFNTNLTPFDNPKVRQALSYAVDRKAIMEAVYYNLGTIATSIIPPSSWAYSKQKYTHDYSIDKAKLLLQEAGFENGFAMEIWVPPMQRSYNPNSGKTAEIIQQSLKELNITAKIVSYDWNILRKKLANGEHQSVLIGWLADNPDPDNFYRPILSCAAAYSGSNRSAWCNDDFDSHLIKAIKKSNKQERKTLYNMAEQVIADEVPLVPIIHSNRFKVQHDDIQDVMIYPFGGIDFSSSTKGN